MRITIQIPAHDVQRQFFKVGDGILAQKSKQIQDRTWAEIVEIEYEEGEQDPEGTPRVRRGGGGSFNAG